MDRVHEYVDDNVKSMVQSKIHKVTQEFDLTLIKAVHEQIKPFQNHLDGQNILITALTNRINNLIE